MDQPIENIRILMLEDVPSDAELEETELRDAGLVFTWLRVDTREAFEQALDSFKPDIILADYRLSAYSGRDALEYTRRTHPQMPVIMVTGSLGDEAAVELLKMGARDYVLKDNLARLALAIKRTLSEEHGIRNRKLAEGKYQALFAEATDGIVLINCNTKQVIDCNPAFERICGRALDELKVMKIWELSPKEKLEAFRSRFMNAQEKGSDRSNELELQKPDGTILPIDISAKHVQLQDQDFIQAIVRDISERLLIEQSLRDSEARYKRISEELTDYQYTVRIENGRVVETIQSPACVRMTGYKAKEFAANPNLWIQMVVPEDRERVIERLRKVLAGMDVPDEEHRIIRKDGELRWMHCTIILFRDASGKLLSYDAVNKDITERKHAELSLRDSEEKFRSITSSAQDAILMMDNEGKISYWNTSAEKIFGYPVREAIGQTLHDLLAPVRFHEDFHKGFSHFKETGEGPIVGKTVELTGLRKDGTEFSIELSLSGTKRDGLWHAIGIVRDITARKRTEDALLRANRALRTLSAGNLALVRAVNEDELLREVTKVIVEKGGYRLAVVEYADNNPAKSITPMAWSGTEDNHYWAQHLSWAYTEQDQFPVSKAIRSGTPQICRDIASDPEYQPWRDAALARGYVSNIALPIANGGRIFGSLSIYSSEAESFDDEEVRLLEELANDLAYGIITLRTRVAHEQQATILRQSLEQSIQTIAGTVEARDPYTAGHQQRVAELATAIALEMGLPEEQVNGIHLAAIIHDLGKIHVPAEILSKPGKLTDIEYMLIKTHPQAGYDILKDVKFPWPIADIIMQHHERLDSSGYPQGLKEGQILLETKILTVADVVEAMSSHRPYRPSLGIGAALNEIKRGRGSAYDPAVVDSCLILLEDKGFQFSSDSVFNL